MKIFDSHFHIINFDYPVKENNGYMPSEFKEEDYEIWQKELGIDGGVIVSGSFQGFDQDYLIHALKSLKGHFVGTTQLPVETSDEKIIKLNELGVRGVRFNVKATGFGRIEVDPLQILKALMEINSNAIMFGTDLPSTRAKRPYEKSDIELIEKNFSKEEQEKIFYKNAMHFYRITK